CPAGSLARDPGGLGRDPPQGRRRGVLRRARGGVHVPRDQPDPAAHPLSRLPDLLADRDPLRAPRLDRPWQPAERTVRGAAECGDRRPRGGPARARSVLRAGAAVRAGPLPPRGRRPPALSGPGAGASQRDDRRDRDDTLASSSTGFAPDASHTVTRRRPSATALTPTPRGFSARPGPLGAEMGHAW